MAPLLITSWKLQLSWPDDQSWTSKKFAFALTWAKRAKTIGLMPEKHMEFINPTKTIKFGVTVLVMRLVVTSFLCPGLLS